LIAENLQNNKLKSIYSIEKKKNFVFFVRAASQPMPQWWPISQGGEKGCCDDDGLR
jgi:hypothetical protein